jgi:transcriptional regulator NrdR family protein
MNNENIYLTRTNLIQLGLTNYQVNFILKKLVPSYRENSVNLYNTNDVICTIEKEINNPKRKNGTKENLGNILKRLKPIGNIIEIDFLSKLSPSEQVVFLQDKLAQLESKEKQINLKTNQILKRAELALSK